MIRLVLRVVAIGVALGGLVDPAWAVRRERPVRVDIRTDSTPEAAEVRSRIVASAGLGAELGTGDSPDALVLIGHAPMGLLPERIPISTVSMARGAAGARVLTASLPESVLPGQQALVSATIEGTGVAGRTTAIVLERSGIALARLEHRWSAALERFDAELRYTPPSGGATPVRVAAYTDGTPQVPVAAVDLLASARTQPLRVLIYEPRPSWMAGFVRRTLEADPAFVIAARARSSRDVEVSTGQAPGTLTAGALKPFDAAVIGAPEALTPSEVSSLETFTRLRGGSVILLPDRRPSGAYLRLLPVERFDEALVEQPVAIDTGGPPAVRAAELSIPVRSSRGAAAIGTVVHAGTRTPIIVSWPLGAGRIVFSGALDAWRYRAMDDEGFARFWSGTIGSLALAAPPVIDVRIDPAIAAPDEPVTVRAKVRATDIVQEGTDRVVPPLDASLIAADGAIRMLRLWPAAEPGVFTAFFAAPAAGRYDVRVSTAGASADSAFVVDRSARHASPGDDDLRRYISERTGGVASAASDLDPLRRHLQSLGREQRIEQRHPFRSGWWLLVFAAALSAEWTLRRRSGSR